MVTGRRRGAGESAAMAGEAAADDVELDAPRANVAGVVLQRTEETALTPPSASVESVAPVPNTC